MTTITLPNAIRGGYNDWNNEHRPEGDKQVVLGMKVVDPLVTQRAREQGVDLNVFERPFALIPTPTSGWKEIDMKYTGTHRMGSRPEDWEDMYYHELKGLKTADVDAIRQNGVAFGLRYNRPGQEDVLVWAQNPGQNYGFYHLQG